MSASEFKDLSAEDLEQKRDELRQQLHNLTIQLNQGQLKQKHLVQQTRRDIARVTTIINSRQVA